MALEFLSTSFIVSLRLDTQQQCQIYVVCDVRMMCQRLVRYLMAALAALRLFLFLVFPAPISH